MNNRNVSNHNFTDNVMPNNFDQILHGMSFYNAPKKTTNRQTSVFQPRVPPQIPHEGLCSIKCRCNPFNI